MEARRFRELLRGLACVVGLVMAVGWVEAQQPNKAAEDRKKALDKLWKDKYDAAFGPKQDKLWDFEGTPEQRRRYHERFEKWYYSLSPAERAAYDEAYYNSIAQQQQPRRAAPPKQGEAQQPESPGGRGVGRSRPESPGGTGGREVAGYSVGSAILLCKTSSYHH